MHRRTYALCIVVAFISGPSAVAQSATISGQTVDLAGRPLAGFGVSVIDTATGVFVTRTESQSSGSFMLTVPRGLYVLMTEETASPFLESVFARADVRNGNASGIVLRIGSRTPVIPETPPRAPLIQVSSPDVQGEVTITAAAGCVPAGTFLALMVLDTGHATTAEAAHDGSFQTRLFAPRGASILIKADSLGTTYRRTVAEVAGGQLGNHLPEMAGTIVRVPEPPSSGSGIPFSVSGIVDGGIQASNHGSPPWVFEGTISSQTLTPGGVLEINGTVRLLSPAVALAGTMGVHAVFRLYQVAAANGTGSQARNIYSSTLITPTGLPIERQPNGRWTEDVKVEVVKTAPERAEAVIHISMRIRQDQPAGFYVPTVQFFFTGVPVESPPSRILLGPLGNFVGRDGSMGYLPVVKIGAPAAPRLPVMLLADDLSDGSRGAQALEDENRFGLASRIRVHQSLVVPRHDANGNALTYRLEPFAPTMVVGVSSTLSLPVLPFRFPSGSLTVHLQKPNGSVTSIGPAPFVQPRLQGKGLNGTSVRDPLLQLTALGGGVMRQIYQLTTLDPRFEVQFDQDGRHVVTLEGDVDDLWGNRWTLGGTYEIHVGRLLSLDPATMPGTPFEVGNVINAGVTISPPLDAEVRVRVRLAPSSDPSRMIDTTVSGRANRFGQFQAREGFALHQPGEYRVDIIATHTDPSGNVWTGARTWGGVVAPTNPPIIGHGRRGMVNATEVSFGSPWYFRSRTPYPRLPDSSHPMPPFHSGDVFWAQNSDTEFPVISFQDPAGTFEGLLRKRIADSGIGIFGPGTFDERATLGELPFFSSRADILDPHVDPASTDLWGYSYRFIERPRIAVREVIGEDGIPLPYWGFNDPYAGQFGMGFDGDQPNDFKFQWGGGVLRGSALAQPYYAIYGSLFVLVPDNDPLGGSRIFPPFRGNGQAPPDGGPLFTLQGKDIDLFFHPTGLRPGSIVHEGRPVSIAGYSAPTLPSKITAILTSPSGSTRTISGQASSIGYFFDPAQDVVISETGVWKAKVRIVFDGRLPSTNGQVEPPYPSGDVLGSREGEFWFYAVDSTSMPLEVIASGAMLTTSAVGRSFVRPSQSPVTFTVGPPSGLSNVEMHTTVTMPGFILEEALSTSLSYTYDAQRLGAAFPNLGGENADTITISFLVSGTDATGARQHRARQVVIQGQELQMPAQGPWPKTFRRRSVR